MSITRRDFLNGVALAIADGLTPAAQIASSSLQYPPALTGMRGQYDGSFEVAHALARQGRTFPIDRLPLDETYDLVVVGGGISGLAAAWFYRRARPSARILILENLDDFGGHAKRNEFTLDGRHLIGYGGSQSLQSPHSLFSPVTLGLLRDLGVDLARFQTAFDRDFYASLGLGRGIFFNREAFGRDVLVVGEPERGGDRASAADKPSIAEYVSGFPISEADKAQIIALYAGRSDPLAGKSPEEKRDILRRTSYRDYLTKICGCSEDVANCFQGRPLGFFGLGSDSVPAADARDLGYPGFAGLNLPADTNAAWNEPYIYHFPDGNASIARLLVRDLVPGVAPGAGMEDVVLASFDYGSLDRADQPIRIRLGSTCVHVGTAAGRVEIGYVRDSTLHKIDARHAVLACFHMMIPYLMPQLPEEQRAALARNVKTPICYTNVLLRDWRAFANLKVSAIAAPMGFHHQVSLDFPIDLGGYRHPRDPSQPIVVHMAHVAGAPNQGFDARTQFRIGQNELLAMTFGDFERLIRNDLDRMLGPGGFDSTRDIAAITVNRWSHGYSYVANSLFDPDDYEDRVLKVARRPFGPVAIANTDSGGDAWLHFAIDQAHRAVKELLG